MKRGRQRLFCYGTLMFPMVMRQVTGWTGSHREASLPGFAVRRLRGVPYPGLVPGPGAVARGVLYEGLTSARLRCLDDYEGEFYRRQRVKLADGTLAWAYVVAPRHRQRVSDACWDATHFARRELSAYLGRLGRRVPVEQQLL